MPVRRICTITGMRIIAGEHRGRRIRAPEGRGTRPMLDRVREALFSTLQAELPGAVVLDLFAGSGSLGLEALSRGAERARLVESDPRALRLLRANVEALGLEDRAEVVPVDALSAAAWEAGPFDLVFLDPPYPLLRDAEARRRLMDVITLLMSADRAHLSPGGTAVLHAPRGELAPTDLPAGLRSRERPYGSSSLWYLEPGDAA
jgi:16S rRNA (guanine966-N2)-methyltransferase